MTSCKNCEREIATLKHFSDAVATGEEGTCPECGEPTTEYECGSMDEDGNLDVRATAYVPEGW